jgi:DNA mismatch endonuclease (patch repair protein)
MSKIKGKNTKPEKALRSALFQIGFRFRIHADELPGKPDIVLPKYRTVIFVHGCFWHKHKNCREGRVPSTNSGYWKDKLDKNTKRDADNFMQIKTLTWQVVVVWECEIEKQFENTLMRLVACIKGNI